MKFENLVKRFNETTIKDDVYGAMSNIEDIKEAFGLDINIQEETKIKILHKVGEYKILEYTEGATTYRIDR